VSLTWVGNPIVKVTAQLQEQTIERLPSFSEQVGQLYSSRAQRLQEQAFEFKFKSEARPIASKEKPQIQIIFAQDQPSPSPNGLSLVYRVREQPASLHRALALFGGLVYAL